MSGSEFIENDLFKNYPKSTCHKVFFSFKYWTLNNFQNTWLNSMLNTKRHKRKLINFSIILNMYCQRKEFQTFISIRKQYRVSKFFKKRMTIATKDAWCPWYYYLTLLPALFSWRSFSWERMDHYPPLCLCYSFLPLWLLCLVSFKLLFGGVTSTNWQLSWKSCGNGILVKWKSLGNNGWGLWGRYRP